MNSHNYLSGSLHLIRKSRRHGSAFIFTVIIVGILAIMIGGLMSASIHQRKLSDRYQIYTREFAAAEFVLNKAFGELSYALKKGGVTNPKAVVEGLAPGKVANFRVHDFQVTLVSDDQGAVPDGQKWSGYNLRRLTYRFQTNVKRDDSAGKMYEHPGVTLQQEIRITYLPLNVFGLFYENDLEVNNGQSDFIFNGRVHTNSSMFYGGDGKKQQWKDRISAVGDFTYGRS